MPGPAWTMTLLFCFSYSWDDRPMLPHPAFFLVEMGTCKPPDIPDLSPLSSYNYRYEPLFMTYIFYKF
jgi:hypothetical protein